MKLPGLLLGSGLFMKLLISKKASLPHNHGKLCLKWQQLWVYQQKWYFEPKIVQTCCEKKKFSKTFEIRGRRMPKIWKKNAIHTIFVTEYILNLFLGFLRSNI